MIRLPVLAALVLSATLIGAEGDAQQKPSKEGTLVVRLHGQYELHPPERLFGGSDMSLFEATTQLKNALKAPEQRVVLDASVGFAPSLAAAEELASVIRESKGQKKVSLLIDEADDKVMVVAAACDEVVMPEAGLINVEGIALSTYYFADALAKLGIHFHAVASGAHKTAHEALTRSGPSPAAIEEYQQLAEDLDQAELALCARPNLTAEAVKAARAQAPQVSRVAKELKLVDVVAEPGEWLEGLPAPRRLMPDGRKSIPDLSSFGGMMQFWGQLLEGEKEEKQPKVVAVVELEGEIVEGRDGEPGVNIAPGDTCRMLAELRDDARVVAVVLRIDSPGGSAEASDRIHHAVRRLAEKKPVVALFDRVAASGGYYIGCAAKEIQVHHATITGSIGVFALAPDASGALEALGIHRHLVTTGPRADLFGLGTWDAEKDKALLTVVEDVDQRFQGLVAECRHLDPAKVKDLAGGRVYTGDRAIALGLADSVGTLVSAVARARALANEPNPLPLERYPHGGGLLAKLGLANTTLGPVPASLRLWIEAAHASAPVVMAWSNCTP
jgi:protease-4